MDKHDHPADTSETNGAKKLWANRILFAAVLSLVIHGVILFFGHSDYRAVADYAINMDILEVSPEPSPTAPDPKSTPKPVPAPDVEPEVKVEKKNNPTEELPIAINKKTPEKIDSGVDILRDASLSTLDPKSASSDAGPSTLLDASPNNEVDSGIDSGMDNTLAQGGMGGGTGGICFHDLFPFAVKDPSWLMWISMASLRETAFEQVVQGTLGSFSIYQEMINATKLKPEREIDSLLVTANNVFDWKTFRVAAVYNSGEEHLKSRIKNNLKNPDKFDWNKTSAGFEGLLPDHFRWHLVGSGRVMVITKNPKTQSKLSFSDWPTQLTCMTPPIGSNHRQPKDSLLKVARAQIGPDKTGHWPVMLIATRDPRAIGLPRNLKLAANFKWVAIGAYLSDPIRLTGVVHFDGSSSNVVAVESLGRKAILNASKDPLLALSGLSNILKNIKISTSGSDIHFELPMTEGQIKASLIFLQLQGESLARHQK